MEQFWRNFEQKRRDDSRPVENIWECYQTYLQENEDTLEQQFQEQNEFQTSVRGLKVRGVYETEAEAKIRCQVLQKFDKTHSVFVAPVGYWLPWDPNPDRIENQEYQLKQLNDLMKNYNQNEKKEGDLKAEKLVSKIQKLLSWRLVHADEDTKDCFLQIVSAQMQRKPHLFSKLTNAAEFQL